MHFGACQYEYLVNMHFDACQFDYLAKDAYLAPKCLRKHCFLIFLFLQKTPHTYTVHVPSANIFHTLSTG